MASVDGRRGEIDFLEDFMEDVLKRLNSGKTVEQTSSMKGFQSRFECMVCLKR